MLDGMQLRRDRLFEGKGRLTILRDGDSFCNDIMPAGSLISP